MSAFISIDDIGELGANSTELNEFEKPEDMSFIEWRKILREKGIDEEELAEREERRKNREEGYPQYQDTAWKSFKRKWYNTVPDSSTRKSCCCFSGLCLVLLVVLIFIIVLWVTGFYVSHVGLI